MKLGLAILEASLITLIGGGSYFFNSSAQETNDTRPNERAAFYEKCAADNPDSLNVSVAHPCHIALTNPRRYGKPFCPAGWCE